MTNLEEIKEKKKKTTVPNGNRPALGKPHTNGPEKASPYPGFGNCHPPPAFQQTGKGTQKKGTQNREGNVD